MTCIQEEKDGSCFRKKVYLVWERGSVFKIYYFNNWKFISVWLRIRFISIGLKPGLNYTLKKHVTNRIIGNFQRRKKICEVAAKLFIQSYYRHLSVNIKI